jgi:hypothetical protein
MTSGSGPFTGHVALLTGGTQFHFHESVFRAEDRKTYAAAMGPPHLATSLRRREPQ